MLTRTPDIQDIVDVKRWSLLRWFVLPCCLLAILVLYPPHSFDLALSRLFYHHGWISGQYPRLFSFVYQATKAIPVIIFLYLGWSWWELRAPSKLPDGLQIQAKLRLRILYVLLAMILCACTIAYLKQTTGVYCPWSMTDFGGLQGFASPTFGLQPLPGRCWPGGHASTGFCLLALFFALRDFSKLAARRAFGIAVLIGCFAAITRMMQGAHFFSHNVATFLICWLICATLYVLIFDRHSFVNKIRTLVKSKPTIEVAILLTSLWWTLVFDRPFFTALSAKATADNAFFLLVLSISFLLISMAILCLLSAVLPRIMFSGLLVIFAFCGAVAYTGETFYGVIFTPDMARNYLATDWREATAYLSPSLVLTFVVLVLPPYFFARISKTSTNAYTTGINNSRLYKAVKKVLMSLLLFTLGVGLLFSNLQRFSSEMRTHRTLRYQIAPFNIPYSLTKTLLKDSNPESQKQRLIIDAAPLMKSPEKPVFLAVFVGETTRSANWQLSGYSRETAPRLSAMKDIISFPEVITCGSSTDLSLPCMMSRIGRSDYNRSRIVSEESLLNLIARAGVHVEWIDNQSGCKGVCQGIKSGKARVNGKDCPNGICYDSVLVTELEERLKNADPKQSTVIFLHMYGSHGPAYYKASRAVNKRFLPECESANFGQCTDKSIRNAYDNSVRETDEVLAEAIERLRAFGQEKGMATGMLWVSDHGESLGENGLYLHGAPYVIAPSEQTRVPMVMWFSEKFRHQFPQSITALEKNSEKSTTHEHLFSTLLSLLNIESKAYRRAYDLTKNQ